MADQASFTEKRNARVFAKRRHLQHQLTSPLPSPSPTGNISTKVLHAFKSQSTPQSASSLNSSTRSNSLNSSILSTLKALDTSHYPLAETMTPPAMKALSFENDILWAPSDMIEPLQEAPMINTLPVSDDEMKEEQISSSSRKRRASSLSVHTESFFSDEDMEPVEITKRVRTRAEVVNDADESSRTPHSLSEYDTDDEPSQELTIATTSLDQDSCGSPNSAFPSPSPSPIVSSTEPHQNFTSYFDAALTGRTLHSSNTPRPIRNLPSILSTFDTLPQATQSYLLFQLLRRSSTTTLQFVNALVIPALKRDFLASLPFELSLHILRYLDVVTLCRAAQVSKKWRMVVDADATIWRQNIERDGFKFTLSEVRQVVARQAATRAARKQKMIVLSDHRDSSAIATMDVDDPEESRLLRKVIAESDHICVNNTDDAALASQGTPTSSSSMSGTSAPLEPSTPHPYKEIYRKHFIIRQNWKRDRATHISFQGHANNVVTCLQYDDDKIISGSDDRCINVYDTNTGKLRKTMSDHEGGVWALQYVGNTLVSGSTDRTVRVWDIERGTSTHVFPGHTSTVRCLQIVMPEMIDGRLQPSRPLIVTGSRDSTLRVWRLPDPVNDEPYLTHSPNNPWFMHTLAGHTQSVRAIAARGNLLVSGSYDYTMRLWNIETGRLIHLMEGHTQRVYSVVLDIDNRRCMSGSMDSTVRIWSLDDGSCLNVLEGHSILVGLLHLTPNHLVSAAADSTLRIWSTETGICEHVLSGHQAAITCFQHDENKVVSGSEGGLKLWDINTGQLVRDLITNVTGVWRVAFDERRCVAAVNRNNVTWFEVLDYGVQGFEDDTEII